MTFDPKKHKFGMAYVYAGMKHPVVHYDQNEWMPSATGSMVRAPEHDMVPMSKVQPLLDAVKDAIEELQYRAILKEDEEGIGRGRRYRDKYVAPLIHALTAFQANRGDDNE